MEFAKLKLKRLLLILLFVAATKANGHDTFLTFKSHFVKADREVTAFLMNGTFEKSENSVAVERMQDVRIVGPEGSILRPGKENWHLTETLNELRFVPKSTGTHIAGVSIRPRMLEMSADKFNSYLQHDGVLDILKSRRETNSEKPVNEKYSKHVKAMFQVGSQPSDNFDQVFGYTIEIVPQKNPYAMKAGEYLPVLVLFKGEPVQDQLVYASHDGFHKHDEDGQHVEAVTIRTDSKGIAKIKIDTEGRWYVRLIHMVPSKEKDVDYESNWATLTFELK